ncbi:DMT family transporter [Sulfitobacter sp.]|jgi:S-adenosylmethionine uptake transporter|uniref:DMT family transporter n=1 Tax=Sulfitobacter sp. TaxID=1903071 RepID=UPI003F6B43F3
MSPNLIGALFMVGSMAAFTLNDTMTKTTGGAVPLFQLLFLRGLISISLIMLLWGRLGPMHLRLSRRDWKLVGIRSGSEVAASFFFVTALFNMPLANLSAILQSLPLTVTLGAALFYREPVGWKRFSAILVGFMGVMLIVKPGTDGFNVWSVYALIAVMFVTIRDLSTRRLSKAVPSMTVTFAAVLSVTVFSAFAQLATPWAPVSAPHWQAIAAAAVFVLMGYYFSVQTMRTGDVSFIAPFRYTGLIWALILGWFVFGDWPLPSTLIGAAIVAATGLFTLYRERKLSRRVVMVAKR